MPVRYECDYCLPTDPRPQGASGPWAPNFHECRGTTVLVSALRFPDGRERTDLAEMLWSRPVTVRPYAAREQMWSGFGPERGWSIVHETTGAPRPLLVRCPECSQQNRVAYRC